MTTKREYFLICHVHLFYLYQKEGESVTLLATERHYDPLLDLVNDLSIRTLTLVDHSSFQHVKVESAAKALPLYQVLGWYWQKKKYLKQCFSHTFSQLFLDQKSLVTATLEQNPILSGLIKELRQKKVRFKIVSYPLVVTSALNRVVMQEFHDLRFSLVVIIDRFSNAVLSFFHGSKLVFIRKLTPSPQEPSVQQFKNLILDTLKLMEKKVVAEKISLLFFIEGSFDASSLMQFFSYGTFFFKEELVLFLKKHTHFSCVWSCDTCLDIVILSEKKNLYTLKSHEKFDSQLLVEKLSPYTKILIGGALTVNICLIYASLHLISEVGASIAQSQETKRKIEKIKNKIHNFPLTLDEIKKIQSIHKKSLIQEHQLFSFLDVLGHSLDQQYVLKSLSIGGQKVKFFLSSIEKEGSFDHFLELWHHSFSDSHISHTPDQSSSLLGVETSSPLVHEKIF